MSQELLQQLHAALSLVLGGGNSNGLGFCEIPQGNDQVKFIFPGYTRQQPPFMHFLGEKDRAGNSPHIPVPGNALKGKLKFLNLIDVVSNGEEKQKLCFWIDCGSITYVLWLGWSDAYGKLNNATESFLKALASLTPEELLEPFTFTLSRLIDKPSYDPTKGNPATAGKVLLVDVWKNDGTPVFSEQGSMDANAACQVILRINHQLTGQAVLTPRQPKTKTVLQEPQYQQNLPAPVAQQQPPQQQWGSPAPTQYQQPQNYQQPIPQQPQNYQQPAPVVQPQQPIPQNYQQQYQQSQNLPQTTPQPSQQPQVQTLPVVGGLTPEQMAQFLAFQQQQAQNQTPQTQNLAQAQQSLTPPPQWGSPAPTPTPQPVQNSNGNGKVNW